MGDLRAWRNLDLGFGVVNVTVSIAKLADDNDPEIEGHYYCPDHKCQLSQQYYCTECDNIVERVHGFAFEDKVVIPEDWEIDGLTPMSTERIELTGYVDADSIDPIYYEGHYLIWPKTNPDAFSLFVHVLKGGNSRGTRKALVGKTLFNKKTQLFVIEWSDALQVLVGHVLTFDERIRWRHVDQVKDKINLPEPTQEEIDLTNTILETLDSVFVPELVHDEYAENLKALIGDKAKGKPTKAASKAKRASEPAPDDTLLDALKATAKSVKAKK